MSKKKPEPKPTPSERTPVVVSTGPIVPLEVASCAVCGHPVTDVCGVCGNPK